MEAFWVKSSENLPISGRIGENIGRVEQRAKSKEQRAKVKGEN